MKTISLALASSFLASSAFAQIRIAAPTPGAAAWAGPIAAFATELGASGIRDLDTVCLPRLTSLGSDGLLPLVKSPALLNPLAQTLAEAYVDPAGFTEMPMEFKATILRTAASLTESRLGASVRDSVERTQKGIGRSQFHKVALASREARATSLYLDEKAEASLSLIEKRVSDYAKAREEAVRAFLEDLPAKIAAGAFDGKSLLISEADGDKTNWLFADGPPNEIHGTPREAFSTRVIRLIATRPGPWTVAEAALVRDALTAYLGKGDIGYADWLLVDLKVIAKSADRSRAASSAGRLKRATAHFSGKGRVNAKDALAVEAFYADNLLHNRGTWLSQARMLATIRTGGLGLPGWERLRAAKDEASARMNRLALLLTRGSVIGALGTLGMIHYGISTGAAALLIGASLLAFLTALYNKLGANALASTHGRYLDAMMERYFKLKAAPPVAAPSKE